jgi:hypothetical protein
MGQPNSRYLLKRFSMLNHHKGQRSNNVVLGI